MQRPGRQLPLQREREAPRVEPWSDRARGDRRRGWNRGILARGRVRGRARQLQPAAAAADRDFDPGLSGKGLFRHFASRAGRRGAPDQYYGPLTPDRALEVGRLLARGRYRRAHWLRHRDERDTLHRAGPALSGMVSKGGTAGGRPVLDGSAPGDAQQPATDRAIEIPQSLPEHRTRHLGLDAGLRLRAGAGRHRQRPQARAPVRLSRNGSWSKRGDLLGRPSSNRLEPDYFAPAAARFRAATSRGLGTASTVISRTKFGSANRAWCVLPL